MAKDQTKTRALAALLDSSTLTEAAEKAEISRKTLYNYMREDKGFARAYQAAQEQIALEQMDALATNRDRARAVILSLMEDVKQPAAIRLKAAQSILEAAANQQKITASIAKANATKNPLDDMFM